MAKPKSKSIKTAEVVVLPKSAKVSLETESTELTLRNPLIPQFTNLGQIGEWLKTEVQAFERDERALTLRMVRIGMVLVWVEKTQPRGAQASLLQLHFGNRSEGQLKKYITAARKVMRELGMLSGNKLAESTDLSQVVLFQPDLFDDAETLKHNTVLKKVSDFIGGRSLSKLLQEDSPLALGEPDLPGTRTPNGHQKDAANNRNLKTPEMIKRQAFQKAFLEFQASFMAKEWQHLYRDTLPDTELLGLLELEGFLKKAHAEVTAHNREQALKERTSK